MKTRLSTAVLMACLVAGCAMPTGNTPGPGGTGTGNGSTTKPGDKSPIVDPKTGKPLPNQPVEPLNGIEFKALTQGAAQYLSANGGNIIAAGSGNLSSNNSGGMTATAPAAAPMAKAAPSMGGAEIAMDSAVVSNEGRSSAGGGAAAPAGGAFSGNVWSPYSFGYYFGYGGGGGMDQMALVSVQEAETKGSTGTFQNVIGDVVGPIVKVWAADARLTQSGAVLTTDGKLYVEPRDDGNKDMLVRPAYGPFNDGNGWRLVYTSSDRSEILNFTVTAEKTTIIRMRWAPLDLAPERVTVDSSDAVRKLVAAISDKGFKGEEEKSMKDYFMGYPFEQPKTGEWDSPDNKTEVLYEVPKNARWNVNLQNVMGKVVWELNWWAQDEEAYPMKGGAVGIAVPAVAVARKPMIAPAGGDDGVEYDEEQLPECSEPERISNSYTNWNGQGMVDAETGAVIRFTRPTRNTYSYYNGPSYPCEQPTAKPKPAATPTAAPSASPSPEPTTEASTSPSPVPTESPAE